MSKVLLNTIRDIAQARILAHPDVARVLPSDEAADIAKEIGSDVYMTVLWKIVTEEGTPSDAIRSISIIQGFLEWLQDNITPDTLAADKALSKLSKRGLKLLEEIEARGNADADAEFGVPNEETYTASDGKVKVVGDMHPAYMANVLRKLLRETRERQQ